ncbi:MAG: hypothetical protein KGK07_16365 [Chloroflexota bacterium]|nr:hypothetical protein [Chloroflexota bacterium]
MKSLAATDREAQRAAAPGTFRVLDGGLRVLVVGDYHVEYRPHYPYDEPVLGTGAQGFYVRLSHLRDDLGTDYWAGQFHRTITGALRAARRGTAGRAAQRACYPGTGATAGGVGT